MPLNWGLFTGPVNALALPGGFLFVSNALADWCQRQPDELAFVIGHVMAHLTLPRRSGWPGWRGSLGSFLGDPTLAVLRQPTNRSDSVAGKSEAFRFSFRSATYRN